MIVPELMEGLQGSGLRSRESRPLLISISVRVSTTVNRSQKTYIELLDTPNYPDIVILQGGQGELGNGHGRRDSLSYRLLLHSLRSVNC